MWIHERKPDQVLQTPLKTHRHNVTNKKDVTRSTCTNSTKHPETMPRCTNRNLWSEIWKELDGWILSCWVVKSHRERKVVVIRQSMQSPCQVRSPVGKRILTMMQRVCYDGRNTPPWFCIPCGIRAIHLSELFIYLCNKFTLSILTREKSDGKLSTYSFNQSRSLLVVVFFEV